MGAQQFDYYIFIDYSEDLLGYLVIEQKMIAGFMPKISKFAHYKELKHKSAYLHSIKKLIDKNQIRPCLLRLKIKRVRETPEIYADLAQFLKEHANCLIFISVDDKQYSNFERLVEAIDGTNNKVVKESKLKKDSSEYKISLVLDTLLNIERLKHEIRQK